MTIPAPPADGFGSLAPPDGFPWAYCPAKRDGMIVNGEGPPQASASEGAPVAAGGDQPTSLEA